MSHIVDVRYSGAEWADLMADMRSWLDRRQIEAEEFDCSALGRGVATCALNAVLIEVPVH